MAPGGGPSRPGDSRVRSLAAPRPHLLPTRPGATRCSLGERGLRGHVVRTQCFRFSEEPGLEAEGAVLEVRVPQVRAAALAGKRLRSFAVASQAGAVLSGPGGWGGGPMASCLRMDHRAKRFGVKSFGNL